MKLDRRKLLAHMGAFSAVALAEKTQVLAAGRREDAVYCAARREASGGFSAVLFSEAQGELDSVTLPGRGHGFAVRPGGAHAVCFARRPGDFAVVMDMGAKPRPPIWFKAGEGRHFFGHGVFSPDGLLLYSTENDFENGRGMIGIRDATDPQYRKIGEFPSQGTGPHDMALLNDGRTLVIANGGIETHPATGRRKLNLATMTPSLALIDRQSGNVIEHHELAKDLHQLSIRHLAIGAGDTVVFGCQHQGPLTERPPLIGFLSRGKRPKLVAPPKEVQLGLKNYIGSVSVDPSGAIAVTTSPRGNVALFWDVASARYLGSRSWTDVCGAAPGGHDRSFLLTTGQGRIISLDDVSGRGRPHLTASHWDNHAFRIPRS